ncbi:TatD family hydrolase [Geomonas silvestris]|uniref:TatD family hydrolase n=1 Tax=Geomonas silvestris TaxID=2740184 RepID=A0A6V8MFN3_9BACT|nr:TatD family hydrolase [Geomonas silvestris]GFO58694.1 TatD family hydrolase [Geomonas silvestris]
MFFDSHCHLDAPSLSDDLPGTLAGARTAGVTGFLVPGVHPASWPRIAELSKLSPEIHPAFGVHPMHADLVSGELLDTLAALAPQARAIGEIGLDYQIASPSRDCQREAFRAQLRLAVRAQLPVLLHCRKAFADLLEIAREEGVATAGGVMHAFSGSPELVRECVRLNLYISLAGTVTYRNAQRPPAVAQAVPLERLLLETDAPDLAPEPYRGTANRPEYLLETARRVAAWRGVSLEELAQATSRNARKLFRLPWSPP